MKTKLKTAAKRISEERDRARLWLLALMLSLTSPVAFCAGDANKAAQNILSLVFNLCKVGGIIFLGYGVVQIARSIASPEGDPREMSRGIGSVIGGIVMIIIPLILDAIGYGPTSFNITDGITS